MVYCQKCGAENEDTAKFCKKCGAPLVGKEMEETVTKPNLPQIDIVWVGIGFAIMCTVGIFMSLIPFGGLLGFIIGGIIIGKMSKGVTIVEAGIAGALAAAIFSSIASLIIYIPAGVILYTAVIGFFLALVGGWIGEKWQASTQTE